MKAPVRSALRQRHELPALQPSQRPSPRGDNTFADFPFSILLHQLAPSVADGSTLTEWTGTPLLRNDEAEASAGRGYISCLTAIPRISSPWMRIDVVSDFTA
jgi:hypothetical protein